MSDDPMMNGSAPMPPAGPQSVLPAAPRPSGAPGRTILIAVAGLVVLGAIVGIVVWVLLSASVVNTPVTPGGPGGTGAPGAGGTVTTGAVTPIPDITNADIFTPRNPFKVIPPITITQSSESTSSSSDTSSTALTLTDITTSNGEKVAVVKIGGISYTVGEGDRVGTTDWQVVTINDDNVVFLYGDETITISLGTGTSK